MAPLTRAGRPVFAKNSDRPAGECQPLLQAAAADHAHGTKLSCQYVEIEQVGHTYAFVGSRPYWLWGVEHGVNEHGVAIGNHTIFTKDPVADVGLLGMDLVRLGLERADSARAAIDVVTTLIERHGQGGSGYAETSWPYHNSFLIADGAEAFLLEASARRWALRSVDRGASASNHATIGTDWDRLSSDCERHARELGWWSGTGRFDFAGAYRDTSLAPPLISSARYAATCAVLAERAGAIDVPALERLMRDHNASGDLYRPGLAPDDEGYFSVCMHADPVGTTTASMIVELGEPQPVRVCWVAFCNPCVAPYLPVFLDGRVPNALQEGGAKPSGGAAWWLFKRLLAVAERDWECNGARLRDAWQPFERELARSVESLLASDEVGDPERRTLELSLFMEETWKRVAQRAAALIEQLNG